jgi:hypothetical protein
MKTKAILMIIALAVLTFFSCTKLKSLLDSTSTNLADDDAVTTVALNDVDLTVDNAIGILENSGQLKGELVLADSCPAITVANPPVGTYPKTVTINYGTGCSGYYGSTRSGKIIIVVTNKRSVVGATRTVTFDNYYFNGIKMEGTKVVTTMDPHGLNPVYSVALTGGKLTLPNGKTIEHAFVRQREWIAGWNTPKNIWDDEYLITGTATGKGVNGNSYTNTILTALHWTRACEFIVSGSIKFERTGVEPIVLDYGTGTCDAFATVTRGDQTKQITLKHKYNGM